MRKEVVLGRGELQLPAPMEHQTPVEIHFIFSEGDHFVSVGHAAPEYRAYARQHFTHREWLDDVIVRTAFEQKNLVDFVADSADDNNRRAEIGGAQLLAKLQTAHSREAEVDEHQIRAGGQCAVEGRTSVSCLLHTKPLLLQHDDHRVTQTGVVIDYKNRLHTPFRSLDCTKDTESGFRVRAGRRTRK